MTDRPILFNGPMVRALLNGSKTQTRRVVKARPDRNMGKRCMLQPHELAGEVNQGEYSNCPYGQPSDRLWVRENFQPFLNDECDGDMRLANWTTGENYHCSFPASHGIHEFMDEEDNLKSSVKPSIHMPRWASRIMLEITGVRVERLQEISEADAIAEGITKGPDHYAPPVPKKVKAFYDGSAKRGYHSLWESINGIGSWDLNPWVWVVEFKATP